MPALTLEDIQRIIGLQLGLRNVPPTARIVEDMGAESADLANIIAAVESKYGIRMKESEIARISTPLDLYEAVQSHLSSA
jgi:acyl carrier protein